ncbi:MAG TPA: hypothetical protein VF817_00655 [Patescibacteria group bacterium]
MLLEELLISSGYEKNGSELACLILEKFSNLIFVFKKDDDSLNAEFEAVLRGGFGQEYVLKLTLYPNSACVLGFSVRCYDMLRLFVLADVKRNVVNQAMAISSPDAVDVCTQKLKEDIAHFDTMFERLADYRRKNPLCIMVLSKDKALRKKHKSLISKYEREVRDLIPSQIKYYGWANYHWTEDRGKGFTQTYLTRTS